MVYWTGGYDHCVLWQRDVHPGAGGSEPRTHNVGSAENELYGSLVHLQSGKNHWVCIEGRGGERKGGEKGAIATPPERGNLELHVQTVHSHLWSNLRVGM